MMRNFLRAKIHAATVTEANLHYVGSLSIDEELMEQVGIEVNEVVHLANVSNGERLTTYAIAAPRGSRTFCANGAAAHLVRPGDRIIIFAFGWYTEQELATHTPKLLFLDDKNEPTADAPSREQHAAVVS